MSAQEIEQVSGRLTPRRFLAGTTVVAEGDGPHALYIIRSGVADVVLLDRHGSEHRLNRLGAGATLGEMSIFTGRPAVATVRAATDLEVLMLPESEFHRTAAAFPRIYHNLGAILSERLAQSNRRGQNGGVGHLSVLLDLGAPPLLGYALACSVAWHTRSPTALLVVMNTEPPAELTALATAVGQGKPTGSRTESVSMAVPTRPRATLYLVSAETGQAGLRSLLHDLSGSYDRVFVQVQGDHIPVDVTGRIIALAGANPAPPPHILHPEYTIRAWTDRQQPYPDHAGVLGVPALTAQDEDALRSGVLPPVTRAARVLGWAARDLTGLKVGLALGGGSIKGYAHAGVLQVLNRAGVMVDYVAGTSVGAAVAAMLATRHSPSEVANVLDEIGNSAFRPNVPFLSLLSSNGLREGVQRVAGNAVIENLAMPLGIVTADIVTRREIVFRRGPLWRAVLASMSIPGVYPPVRIGRYLLVDGGLLNPVPSDVAATMGADKVIAVKLTGVSGDAADIHGAELRQRRPTVLQALLRSIETMQSKIGTDTSATATIMIEPPFPEGIGSWWQLRRFSQGRPFMQIGEQAAEAALPRIAAVLPWVHAE